MEDSGVHIPNMDDNKPWKGDRQIKKLDDGKYTDINPGDDVVTDHVKKFHTRASGMAARAAIASGAGMSGPDGAGMSDPDGAGMSGPDGAGMSDPDGAGMSGPDGAGMSDPDGDVISDDCVIPSSVTSRDMCDVREAPLTDDVDGMMGRLIRINMSTPVGAHEYNMSHTKRGTFIIINNKSFQPSLRLSERDGTDIDASRLYYTFRDILGFTPRHYKDLKLREMVNLLGHEARQDHSDSDCFGCAILSHGEEGVVYGTDGEIAVEKLVAPFKGCRSLLSKPKLFFIQACRGEMSDSGITIDEDTVDAAPPRVYRIPREADFLFAYSTVPGYISWRNSENGSWFIQALCGAIANIGQSKNILHILTRTNHEVAYRFESQNIKDENYHEKKQMPSIVSMLTKELTFHGEKSS